MEEVTLAARVQYSCPQSCKIYSSVSSRYTGANPSFEGSICVVSHILTSVYIPPICALLA